MTVAVPLAERLRSLGLIAAVPWIGGCASSALVRSEDATFARAEQRRERTSPAVDDAKPSAPERALFMQAEALYRYRFEPPLRSSAASVAEAAAAVTDFPAFQSFAGSLDLLDLRLRACDGAVQLWETFLVRYPRSTLRPLVLYRLGWAYRSAGASGLPRTSDEAFDALIREEPSSELAGTARLARSVPWKSKSAAAPGRSSLGSVSSTSASP